MFVLVRQPCNSGQGRAQQTLQKFPSGRLAWHCKLGIPNKTQGEGVFHLLRIQDSVDFQCPAPSRWKRPDTSLLRLSQLWHRPWPVPSSPLPCGAYRPPGCTQAPASDSVHTKAHRIPPVVFTLAGRTRGVFRITQVYWELRGSKEATPWFFKITNFAEKLKTSARTPRLFCP